MSAPLLEELRSCGDFEAAAHKRLPEASWEYISGGEADTIDANAHSFSLLGLRPRVLCNVESVDLSGTFFGEARRTPFYLSSVAKGSLVAGRQGERAFVRAATRVGSTYIVPMLTGLPYADVWGAAPAGHGLPYQFYLLEDEAESAERLREALPLGPSALVVTVDANGPRAGSFRRVTGSAVGAFPSPRLTWDKLAELRAQLPPGLPLYLKGIQTGEDALAAVRFGAHGIIVSNHGGRCCASSWGSAAALEDVSRSLAAEGCLDKVEVLFDSGVRSGLDAFKALCLGARGIGLGRPYYWAAACHGEDGVVALLDILHAELQHVMAQVGAASLADLGPHLLCRLGHAPQSLVPLGPIGLRAKL